MNSQSFIAMPEEAGSGSIKYRNSGSESATELDEIPWIEALVVSGQNIAF